MLRIVMQAHNKPTKPPISTLSKFLYRSPFIVNNKILLMKIIQLHSICSNCRIKLAKIIQVKSIIRKQNNLSKFMEITLIKNSDYAIEFPIAT